MTIGRNTTYFQRNHPNGFTQESLLEFGRAAVVNQRSVGKVAKACQDQDSEAKPARQSSSGTDTAMLPYPVKVTHN